MTFDPDLTAIGSGYYYVHVDGVVMSKHLQEREGAEAMALLYA
jgi:hypothetical protein